MSGRGGLSPPAVVLFDLDGTLIDSLPGVARSTRVALEAVGVVVPDEARLRAGVGPPLPDALSGHGVPEDRLDDAMAAFLDHYGRVGSRLSPPVPGVTDLLASLGRAGVAVAVATSKRQPLATRIVAEQGLAGDVAAVVGAAADGTGADKATVIGAALAALGPPGADRTRVVMVGDRQHDVVGARAVGIRAVGVSWGYAPDGELAGAGADVIVDSVAELAAVLGVGRDGSPGPAPITAP